MIASVTLFILGIIGMTGSLLIKDRTSSWAVWLAGFIAWIAAVILGKLETIISKLP